MAADKSSRKNFDHDRGGVNPPPQSAEDRPSYDRRAYSGERSWEFHPLDPASMIREGRHFLPLGVYARQILLRRDADVGRLMLSLAAHRGNCIAWDLLPADWNLAPLAPALQLPWTLARPSGKPDFARLHSAYFARLDVLLHAMTESDLAILLRVPTPRQIEALRIPADAWQAFLAELAVRLEPYPQVGFAVDLDGYLETCAVLAPRIPGFRAMVLWNPPLAATEPPPAAVIERLQPRPRLLWIHHESLLAPPLSIPAWTGPVLHSYARASQTAPIPPAISPAAASAPASDPASLAAAWNAVLQGAGVLWSYADVGIFQNPLRDLTPLHGIANILEDLHVEWTGLAAARQVFEGHLVQQPQAAISRGGVLVGFYPQLHGDGIRAWLQPVAHRVQWYRPPEAHPHYVTGGIVGAPFGAVAIPTPAKLVGGPAVLVLVPEN